MQFSVSKYSGPEPVGVGERAPPHVLNQIYQRLDMLLCFASGTS